MTDVVDLRPTQLLRLRDSDVLPALRELVCSIAKLDAIEPKDRDWPHPEWFTLEPSLGAMPLREVRNKIQRACALRDIAVQVQGLSVDGWQKIEDVGVYM